MLHPKRLPVGLERDKHIIKRFFHRDRPSVRRGIRPFDVNPFVRKIASSIQPRLFEKRAQRDTRVFHVVDHAVRELRTVELGTCPLHARVCRALKEIGAIFAREAFQIGVGKDQRTINETVDHQTVIFLFQLNRARVVAFKRAPLWRDRAVKRVDRREVDRGDHIRGEPRHVAADHIALKLDRHPVGRGVNALTG